MERTDHLSSAPAGDKTRGGHAPCVLQLVPHMGAGGVQRGTVEVARALVAAGWRAMVASAGGPGVEALEAAGARHVMLPLHRKDPVSIARNGLRLARLVTAEDVDIVHARSRAPAWCGWLATRRTGTPFVTTFHGTYGHANVLKRQYNAVMTRGDAVIAISGHIARHIRDVYGVDDGRVRVIHRGVDRAAFDPAAVDPARVQALRRAWGIPTGALVVMLPGRLTRWKGQAVMVQAMTRLGRRDVHCLLVGDDQGRSAYCDELARRIAELGLGARVRITGPAKDMAAAYLLADLVVSASTDPEAFGRVAVEAQAMGRPVIASAHGGALETVADGVTGWLVPPGDAVALAAAIESALKLSPEARAAIGAAARARVLDAFTTEAMCARTLDVYGAVLAGRAARSNADRGVSR